MIKFGVIVSMQKPEGCEKRLNAIVEALMDKGVGSSDLSIETVPGDFETILAVRCFAENTDVDAVIVLTAAENMVYNASMMTVLLSAYAQITLDWNMPVVSNLTLRTSQQIVEAAIDMVNLQVKLEAADPDNANDGRSGGGRKVN